MPHLFPPPVPDSNPHLNPDPNPNLEVDSDPTLPVTTDSNQLSLANLLTYCPIDVYTAQKVYSAILPSSPSRVCLPWGESTERVYRA